MASYKDIVVDATSGTDVGEVSNFSFNHTVGAGNEGILIFIYSGRANPNPTAVTFNGVALTASLVTTKFDTCWVEFWYLLKPATGTHAIAVTLSEADNNRHCCGAVSFFNVEQTDPIKVSDEQGGVATSFSNPFTSTLDGQYAIEGQSNTQSQAGTVVAGQTLIKARSSANSGGISYKSLGTSGAETVGWTGFAGGAAYKSGLVVIQPAELEGGAFLMNFV